MTMVSEKNEKALVIVESPAKARTISKYLGKNYTVEASIGHVRDLPQGAKEVPEKYKEFSWANLGVNVDEEFAPIYVVSADKKKQITKLKKLLKDVDKLYLATDEDREGEAISWHLVEVLKPKVPVERLVFHEITKEAIQNALSETREIDQGLVKAQETRRILDRLYGYEVSPLLWRKIRVGLSAGRVQSVAVRLVVERELERIAFNYAQYWSLIGNFTTQGGKPFQANLVSVEGEKIPSGKDFDPATGKLKKEGFLQLSGSDAKELAERLATAEFKVLDLQEKPYTSRPAPPFTTSTLQQEANRKLGFTARRTMSVAQSLYENGYITYMRTDSTNLAKVALDAARDLVRSEYGSNFLPDSPRFYKSKVKNAQEAHEAIRPAGHPFQTPSKLKGVLNTDQYRLFELIWKRTIASQMADAKGRYISLKVEGGGALFQASGKIIDFPGFLRAYVEGSDDPLADLSDKESILPTVTTGEIVHRQGMDTKEHTTQPPARFSEASLTRTLEEMGIGRPSTYASIIDTIQAREYVFKKANALVPTWVAFAVAKLMREHLSSLVDYQFTAEMEELLDEISRGSVENIEYLKGFYFGNGKPGLKELMANKLDEVDAKKTSTFPLGAPESGEHTDEVVVRVGRYGPYVEQGDRKASIEEATTPDEVTLELALKLLDEAQKGDEPLGFCPETRKPVYLKKGRFGPYIQLGTPDDEEKPKNAALLKGMSIDDLTLELALKLLSLPRTLGEWALDKEKPTETQPVFAQNGPYGPYVKCGKETRSLPEGISPLEVTYSEAIDLLSKPKTRGRRAAAEPLKKFDDPSPVTEKEVKVLEGRYGPYVTDGTTNASLPKGSDPKELSFEEALDLLAIRAAKGPTKRTRKKATKKTTKKTTKKKTTKKAARKKATKKVVKKVVKKVPKEIKPQSGEPDPPF
ncbi:MAG: type I DNA topoisomerase [Pirellulaceae bacterium]|nr:type I DNA topoisomerase [Pirellulaceae bacterium]